MQTTMTNQSGSRGRFSAFATSYGHKDYAADYMRQQDPTSEYLQVCEMGDWLGMVVGAASKRTTKHTKRELLTIFDKQKDATTAYLQEQDAAFHGRGLYGSGLQQQQHQWGSQSGYSKYGAPSKIAPLPAGRSNGESFFKPS